MKRMMMNRALAALLALMMVFGLIPALAEEGYLQRGSTGEKVKELQARLKELNYLDEDPTGVFDEDTENALIRFQKRNGLLATGFADERTLALLFSDRAAPVPTATPRGSYDYYEDYAVEEEIAAYAPMPSGMAMSAARGKAAWNTNEYTLIRENGFQSVASAPLSTFAADVDTASYAQFRSLVLRGEPVPADAVRVEEMLNYFHYDYAAPEAGHPLGVTMELARCPWNSETLLLQVGLQAEEIPKENRPAHNLVFLIDVSGSMFGPTRLDLVKRAFLLMLDELAPTDTVSVVTYASRDQVLLDGVPAADKPRIMEAISGLEAGGSTNSASGITTAYLLAEKHMIPGGVNRILMATDGDFNVGVTSEGDLARLVMEKKQGGVTLTMLGVGYGNYKDNKLEALADFGNGNYYYLDSIFEARRALVAEAGGTMVEVARDVKLQLDFNPALVSGYRLIGYEDRVMDAADFADDTKDGGEIGSGHRVTALYELIPAGSDFGKNLPRSVYQTENAGGQGSEWCTLNLRYKLPGQTESTLETFPFAGEITENPSENLRFAAAVAECAMVTRGSEFKGTATYTDALTLARSCASVTGDPYKEEFVYLLTLLERKGQ